MNINVLIILICTSIFFICSLILIIILKKYNNEDNTNNREEDKFILLLHKINKIEKDVILLNEEVKKSSIELEKIKKYENDNSTDVYKLINLGYSKEEIAKKTGKSIRELDLILRIKKDDKI